MSKCKSASEIKGAKRVKIIYFYEEKWDSNLGLQTECLGTASMTAQTTIKVKDGN